jgi:hypothetical protein
VSDRETIRQLVEGDQRIRTLEAKTELREERERPSQLEAAEERGWPRDFLGFEESVWKRLSPLRDRWPEVRKFDERVAALEMRQAAVAEELRQLQDRARLAPDADAARLAEWELGDREGDRPRPSLPGIEATIKRLRDEWEGLSHAVARVLDEKADYVEKHRGRLQGQAKDAVDEAAQRYIDLIDQLAAAREELRACRREEVLAILYPRQEAMSEPPDSIAGARKRPLERAGIHQAIAPDRLLNVLREDVRWLTEAATPEQRLAIEGRDPRTPPDTVWVNDPAEKAKRAKAMGEWANSR